ncbi:hypothetical protein KY290_017847 [Solanum tuberosum]|uniref:Uncharacterized protein n=1 Tax=Solanum tuberosum TaxID=4113 RepID=A0ABQ7VCG9_SOLTU|nr:hypothetical protein KY290_017847 [Solanum tuberosum]
MTHLDFEEISCKKEAMGSRRSKHASHNENLLKALKTGGGEANSGVVMSWKWILAISEGFKELTRTKA